MKQYLLMIIILLPLIAKGQLEFKFTDLPTYAIKETVTHVKKLVITNVGKTCKVISLINIPEITGIPHFHNDFSNLTMYVAEYDNTLHIANPDEYCPCVYGSWFKKLDSDTEFTIYFFSKEEKKDTDLSQLIRVYNHMCHYKGTKALDYVGNEIIIPLYEQ